MSKPSGARASAWSASEIVLRQGIQFAVTIILARLLSPEDFGAFALLTFLTGFSIVFLQGGLTIALIQRRETSADEQSAIFWWNLLASLTLGALFIAGAGAFAGFFGQPVLRPLVAVAAFYLVASAAGAVQNALLTRDLRFDVLMKAGVAAALLSGLVAVIAAWCGAGVWALALQFALQGAFNTLLLWRLMPWRPAFHFRFATIRSLFGFGAWVSAGNIVEVLYTSGINLLVGKLYGLRELGFYSRAVATQTLPSSMLSAIVSRVALPMLAVREGDPAALRNGMRLAIATTMAINVPAMAGMAVLSNEIVTVLFGPRWLPAAPLLAILSLSAVLLPMHVINLQSILAQAQTGTFVRVELAKKSVGIVCVVIGSLFGVAGLAWSQVAFGVIALAINAAPARRVLDYGALHQLCDLTGIFCAALIMAGAVFAIRAALVTPAPLTLAICTLCGMVAYGAIGWLTGGRVFRSAASLTWARVNGWRRAE